jgi:hypothetical protein
MGPTPEFLTDRTVQGDETQFIMWIRYFPTSGRHCTSSKEGNCPVSLLHPSYYDWYGKNVLPDTTCFATSIRAAQADGDFETTHMLELKGRLQMERQSTKQRPQYYR